MTFSRKAKVLANYYHDVTHITTEESSPMGENTPPKPTVSPYWQQTLSTPFRTGEAVFYWTDDEHAVLVLPQHEEAPGGQRHYLLLGPEERRVLQDFLEKPQLMEQEVLTEWDPSLPTPLGMELVSSLVAQAEADAAVAEAAAREALAEMEETKPLVRPRHSPPARLR